MEKKFMIVAICDPYNSRFHYRGQRVLEYNMTTPIKWVMEEDLSEPHAHDLLDEYAYDLRDACGYDDEFIEELREDLIEYEELISEEEINERLSWYKGAGFYNEGVLLYKFGDDALRDDVMLYRIEEQE